MYKTFLQAKSALQAIIPKQYLPFASRLKGQLLGYGQKSFAQHGEDLVLRAIFGTKCSGFYVDVGAHHPCHLSNTHYFYRRGWRGINIDPMPNSMAPFRRIRKRDINLECALSEKKEEATLYMFSNSCLNTLSPDYAKLLKEDQSLKFLGEKTITTKTLEEVLDTYLPKATPIDFLSLDAETFDLPILKGNNWTKYRPSVVIVEVHDFSLENPMQSEVYRFMVENHYRLAHIVIHNLFFCSLPDR